MSSIDDDFMMLENSRLDHEDEDQIHMDDDEIEEGLAGSATSPVSGMSSPHQVNVLLFRASCFIVHLRSALKKVNWLGRMPVLLLY